MTNTFVFTRYLYIKDEVEISLVMSLLNNDKKCIFWAYELYYSGFKEELFLLFWKIYYNFYATLNPTFWEYLAKKHKEYLLPSLENDKLVSMIVNNLLIRPFNIDIFLLRQKHPPIIANNAIESDDLCSYLEKKDYASIARCILTESPNINMNITNTVFNFLCSKDNSLDRKKIEKKWANALTCSYIIPKVHLLSIIMSFFSKGSGSKMGKNLYIIVDPDDIKPYATIIVNEMELEKVTANKILQKACIHNIDADSYLSLFQLSRNTIPDTGTCKEAYYYDWLYYASFSPIWLSRIKQHHGYVNQATKQILFNESSSDSDDNEHLFYHNYGYDPGEQSVETQQKNIQDINEVRTWATFYEDKKKNGIYVPHFSEMDTSQY